jgi:hypothetical protein
VALPSSAEYWHIGAMMIRLRSFKDPASAGVNSALIPNPFVRMVDVLHSCRAAAKSQ